MSKLYFKVSSDWEEVVKLRNEIVKLKQELKSMDSTQSPATFKTLNTQLAASTQQLDGLVAKAAQAGAVMEGILRRKSSTPHNPLTGLQKRLLPKRMLLALFKQLSVKIRNYIRILFQEVVKIKRYLTISESKKEHLAKNGMLCLILLSSKQKHVFQ